MTTKTGALTDKALDDLRGDLMRRQVVIGAESRPPGGHGPLVIRGTSYVSVADILAVLREHGWDARP